MKSNIGGHASGTTCDTPCARCGVAVSISTKDHALFATALSESFRREVSLPCVGHCTHTYTHTHTSNVALSQPAFFPSITNSVFDSCTNRVADNLAKCDLYRVAARLLSASPTQSPTTSPTASPTQAPTASPTVSPTLYPTVSSTSGLTQSLSRFPTTSPTTSPHRPTIAFWLAVDIALSEPHYVANSITNSQNPCTDIVHWSSTITAPGVTRK
jgi:hypothetical protein